MTQPLMKFMIKKEPVVNRVENLLVTGTLQKSSNPEVLCENGFLKNFEKFTIKHLCRSLFLKKLAG